MNDVSLARIEESARKYSDARKKVTDLAARLQDKIARLQRAAMPKLRQHVEAATEAELDLRGLVESAPGLFQKPRTMIFHGVKVGFNKGKGGIDWNDDSKVVALIKKNYTEDESAALLHITITPDKEALAKLPAADLKKLGVEIVGAGDYVVVKSTDSEIDKTVTALLKSAADEATKAEEGK